MSTIFPPIQKMAIPIPSRKTKLKWQLMAFLPRRLYTWVRLKRLRKQLAKASELYRVSGDESFRYEIHELETDYESLDTWRLECVAREYGILVPHAEAEWWQYNPEHNRSHLTHLGKTKLQELIRQQRSGRIAFWMPILTALTGLIGVLVGLFSVLR